MVPHKVPLNMPAAQSNMQTISFLPTPLNPPTSSSPRVLIIGGGVTGLVTAWTLLDRGYQVTILSQAWASHSTPQNRLTSQIAGALWEYPPAVCGQHTDAISLLHSKQWCMVSYRIFEQMAKDPQLSASSGVRMKDSVFFFSSQLEDDEFNYQKMKEIEHSGVNGFRRGVDLIKEHGINPKYGVKDAYAHLAPVIDTDQAMFYLMTLVSAKGAQFVTETLTGDLLDLEPDLLARFQASVIVNCTGLANDHLASDSSCYPIRGALIRVLNDGKQFPKVDAALSISAPHGISRMASTGQETTEIVFIVPRSPSILLLGGIAQTNQSDLDLTLDSPVIQRMRQRCEAFLPGLKNAVVDKEYPLTQGLRPFRGGNVRVERELRVREADGKDSRPSRIIHSYGHGGSGWSLSFGCAEDVVILVEEALADVMPTPMTLRGLPVPAVEKLGRHEPDMGSDKDIEKDRQFVFSSKL